MLRERRVATGAPIWFNVSCAVFVDSFTDLPAWLFERHQWLSGAREL